MERVVDEWLMEPNVKRERETGSRWKTVCSSRVNDWASEQMKSQVSEWMGNWIIYTSQVNEHKHAVLKQHVETEWFIISHVDVSFAWS